MIKFIIKNKKIIFSFVLGILFSGVGVYAATTYLASDITYKGTTVEAALNELYNNRNCVSGQVTKPMNSHLNINVGFKPTMFAISFLSSISTQTSIIYNKNISSSVYTLDHYLSTGKYTPGELKSIFNIDSTITGTFESTWDAYKNGYTVYYIACK